MGFQGGQRPINTVLARRLLREGKSRAEVIAATTKEAGRTTPFQWCSIYQAMWNDEKAWKELKSDDAKREAQRNG